MIDQVHGSAVQLDVTIDVVCSWFRSCLFSYRISLVSCIHTAICIKHLSHTFCSIETKLHFKNHIHQIIKHNHTHMVCMMLIVCMSCCIVITCTVMQLYSIQLHEDQHMCIEYELAIIANSIIRTACIDLL